MCQMEIRKRAVSLLEDSAGAVVFRRPRRHKGRPLWVVRKRRIVRQYLSSKLPTDRIPDMVKVWGSPTSRRATELARWNRDFSNDIPFIGDMNPTSLAIWLFLQRDLEPFGISMPWWGIDDAWLATKDSTWVARCCVRMTAADHELWQLLRGSSGTRWVDMIGSNSVALLDSGSTLELEAPIYSMFNNEALWLHVKSKWRLDTEKTDP